MLTRTVEIFKGDFPVIIFAYLIILSSLPMPRGSMTHLKAFEIWKNLTAQVFHISLIPWLQHLGQNLGENIMTNCGV